MSLIDAVAAVLLMLGSGLIARALIAADTPRWKRSERVEAQVDGNRRAA